MAKILSRPWLGQPCEVQGCPGRNFGHGLCQRHYMRRRAGKPMVTWRESFMATHLPKNGLGLIPLRPGISAIVDIEEYWRVSKHNWHWNPVTRYAYASIRGKKVTLHRFISGLVGVDHKNRNRLDHRKGNLRPATFSQNSWNIGKYRGSSKYKGVSWDTNRRQWIAHIAANRKKHFLGRFDSEDMAALAYNRAATKMHGFFAVLNLLPTPHGN